MSSQYEIEYLRTLLPIPALICKHLTNHSRVFSPAALVLAALLQASLFSQLRASQLSAPAPRLSDRACLSVLRLLAAAPAGSPCHVALVPTLSGRALLTPERLDADLAAALTAYGGRLEVAALPDLLDVDAVHLTLPISRLCAASKQQQQQASTNANTATAAVGTAACAVLVAGGSLLLSRAYGAALVAELCDALATYATVPLQAFADRRKLPLAYITALVTEQLAMDATATSATAETSAATIGFPPGTALVCGVLQTPAHAALERARLRGALRALTVPTPLATVAAATETEAVAASVTATASATATAAVTEALSQSLNAAVANNENVAVPESVTIASLVNSINSTSVSSPSNVSAAANGPLVATPAVFVAAQRAALAAAMAGSALTTAVKTPAAVRARGHTNNSGSNTVGGVGAGAVAYETAAARFGLPAAPDAAAAALLTLFPGGVAGKSDFFSPALVELLTAAVSELTVSKEDTPGVPLGGGNWVDLVPLLPPATVSNAVAAAESGDSDDVDAVLLAKTAAAAVAATKGIAREELIVLAPAFVVTQAAIAAATAAVICGNKSERAVSGNSALLNKLATLLVSPTAVRNASGKNKSSPATNAAVQSKSAASAKPKSSERAFSSKSGAVDAGALAAAAAHLSAHLLSVPLLSASLASVDGEPLSQPVALALARRLLTVTLPASLAPLLPAAAAAVAAEAAAAAAATAAAAAAGSAGGSGSAAEAQLQARVGALHVAVQETLEALTVTARGVEALTAAKGPHDGDGDADADARDTENDKESDKDDEKSDASDASLLRSVLGRHLAATTGALALSLLARTRAAVLGLVLPSDPAGNNSNSSNSSSNASASANTNTKTLMTVLPRADVNHVLADQKSAAAELAALASTVYAASDTANSSNSSSSSTSTAAVLVAKAVAAAAAEGVSQRPATAARAAAMVARVRKGALAALNASLANVKTKQGANASANATVRALAVTACVARAGLLVTLPATATGNAAAAAAAEAIVAAAVRAAARRGLLSEKESDAIQRGDLADIVAAAAADEGNHE